MNTEEFILIIEDDTDIRESLIFFLEMEGHVCKMAANGQQGLEFLRTAPTLPRLILLDLMMPIIDGLTFRQLQLEDPRLKHIPVVLLSADRDANVKAKMMGINECVQKPVSLDTLFTVIKKLMISP